VVVPLWDTGGEVKKKGKQEKALEEGVERQNMRTQQGEPLSFSLENNRATEKSKAKKERERGREGGKTKST